MEIVDRREIREHLCTLLQSVIDAEVLLPYQTVSFAGKSPVIFLTSLGSERKSFRTRVGVDSKFWIAVHVFVVHSVEGSWTTQDAEDKIDEIEKNIATSLVNNQTSELWRSVEYGSLSAVERYSVEGIPYLYESIQLVVEAR